MKSKYSQVVKIKKQELDKAENNLAAAKQRQRSNEAALMQAKAEYLSISLPQSGSVQLLRESLSFKSIAKDIKDAAQERVNLSKNECNHYQHLYKNAHLNYEKIKYLETQDLKEYQKQLAKAEQKALDDIATSKFFRERKENEEL